MPINIDPEIDRIYREELQSLTRALSKRTKCVAILPKTVVQCPNCLWDAAMKESSGKYNGTGPKPFTGKKCPVCTGKGLIETQSKIPIQANVHFGKTPKRGDFPMPEGIIFEGQAVIKVVPAQYQMLVKAEAFTLDGVRYRKVGQPRQHGLMSYAIGIQLVQRDD